MTFARKRVAEAIDRLPEAEKLYATLSFFEGVSDAAASRALGVGRADLSAMRERALGSLRDLAPVTSREAGRLKRAVLAQIRARFTEVTGQPLDPKGRAASARAVVVPSVPDAELEAALRDVGSGAGGELRTPKLGGQPAFHSAYSSCAFAVNCFGPWRLTPAGLDLFGRRAFRSLEFETRFPIAPRWRTAPHLDALAEADDHVVAIESKLTEYLSARHTAEFRDDYDRVVGERADPTWRERYSCLRESPDEYAFFNAAQIVKHYLGLKTDRGARLGGRSITLLYLYWEPENPQDHRLFAQHRAEVADFAEALADPQITFASLSCRELWDAWRLDGRALEHVAALEARYNLRVEP